jgi:hypothetical protein
MKKGFFLIAIILAVILTGCDSPVTPDPPTLGEISIIVLDGVGGSVVEDATVTIQTEYAETVKIVQSNTQGLASVELEVGTYTISAEKDDFSASSFQDLTLGKEGAQIALYPRKLGMISYPAEAPEITSIEYSTDAGATYEAFSTDGSWNEAALPMFRITVEGGSGVEETAWSGYGLALRVDGPTNRFEKILPEYEVQSFYNGERYESIGVFDLSAFELTDGVHLINLVAYDVANNRVETEFPISITNAVLSGDTDLAAVQPVFTSLEAKTFGHSRNLFGISPKNIDAEAMVPYEGSSTTYYVTMSILTEYDDDGDSGTPDVPASVRSIKLMRSEDDVTFEVVQTLTYSELNASGVHDLVDADPWLEPGNTYSYKAVAYNASGASLETEAVAFEFLAPFHLNLLSPAQNSISDTTTPVLTFSLSRSDLFTLADEFVFDFEIREKLGPAWVFTDVTYDCETDTFYAFGGPAPYFSRSGNTISLDLAAVGLPLERGKTYEWNVLKQFFGPFFKKYGDIGFAISHSSTYGEGYDADNGYFTLTIASDAQ